LNSRHSRWRKYIIPGRKTMTKDKTTAAHLPAQDKDTQEPSVMKRKLFYVLVLLYLVLTLSSIFFGNPHLSTSLTPFLNVFILLVVAFTTFYSIRQENILSPLFVITVFFFFVIWTGFNFIFSDLQKLSKMETISAEAFQKTYYVIFAGFVSFAAGYILISRFELRKKTEKLNLNEIVNNKTELIISIIIVFGLLLKTFSQFALNIGIAGIRPDKIPFSGVIYFLAKLLPVAGFCLLFTIELKRKNKIYRLLLVIFILTYIALDILAGWKSAPLKIFLLLFVIYFSKRGVEKLNLRTLTAVITIMVVAVLSYSLVWEYRVAIKNIYRKENIGIKKLKRKDLNAIEKIKNLHKRFAFGVINFINVMEYHKGNKELLSIENFYTQKPNASKFLTRTIYNVPKTVVVGRTASFWGNLYIYGRLPAVLAGFLILGIIARLFFTYLYKRENHYLFLSVKALYIAWFFKLVMGGMIYHSIKEVIAYAFILVLYKIPIDLLTKKKRGKTVQQ
jgi:hypothetical protein